MAWICEQCSFIWRFPVDKCIKCSAQTKEYASANHVVKGITEVLNPSIEHNEVPYYVLLLEDSNGRMLLRKSFHNFKIGHEIIEGHITKPDLPRIGIVGTGVTSVGIAQVALLSGCNVVLRGRSDKSLNKAVDKIEKSLSKRMDVNKLKIMMSSLKSTTDISEFSDADIVIETVTEDLAIKHSVFNELDSVCREHCILATNTSSLSIDEIAKAVTRPERVIGMHFFNPIPKMRLVEIIYGDKTAQSTIDFARKTTDIFNKTPVIVKNSPGFIVNRILMTLLNEAVQVLEEKLATKEDIDRAIELGLNHPMGPLKLLDLIGIDIFHDIMITLQNYQPDKFRIPRMIKEMKDNNILGRKTGHGFYFY